MTINQILEHIWNNHWVKKDSLRYFIEGGRVGDEPVVMKVEFTIMPSQDEFKQLADDLADYGVWMFPRRNHSDSNQNKEKP